MATYLNDGKKVAYAGLSTDAKPLNLNSDGAMFYEINTSAVFMYNKEANIWEPQSSPMSWFVYQS